MARPELQLRPRSWMQDDQRLSVINTESLKRLASLTSLRGFDRESRARIERGSFYASKITDALSKPQ
jgi:hypothetical protein